MTPGVHELTGAGQGKRKQSVLAVCDGGEESSKQEKKKAAIALVAPVPWVYHQPEYFLCPRRVRYLVELSGP